MSNLLKISKALVLLATAQLLLPSAAMAACNGGACPIGPGSSVRVQIGVGLALPRIAAGPFLTEPQPVPTGQLAADNTAKGGLIGVPGLSANVVPGPHPRRITIPSQIATYGVPSTSMALVPQLAVGLRPFAPGLLGVVTAVARVWPAATANFSASGRSGADNVSYCAGNPVPADITTNTTWTGGCVGANTTISGGAPTIPGIMRYTKTASGFKYGGRAANAQGRTPGGAIPVNQLGKIIFNPNAITLGQLPGTVAFSTLNQNIETRTNAWGAGFGLTQQKIGTPPTVPGNFTGMLGPAGTAIDVNTWVATPLGNPGLVQTSTTWGGPFTTGVLFISNPGQVPPQVFTVTGNDERDPVDGDGILSLVSGTLAQRNITGNSIQRLLVTLNVPEPSMALGLLAGLGGLVLVRRRKA